MADQASEQPAETEKPDYTWRITNRAGKAEIEIGDWPAPDGPKLANLDEIRMHAIGRSLIQLGTGLVSMRDEDFQEDED